MDTSFGNSWDALQKLAAHGPKITEEHIPTNLAYQSAQDACKIGTSVANEMAAMFGNDFMDQNPLQSDSRNADWQPCPAGTLNALANDLRGQQFRRRLGVASAAAAGVFVLAIGVFSAIPGPAPAPVIPAAPVAAISCREVRANAPQYLAGAVGPELKARMDQHLGKCRSCEKFVHGERPAAKCPKQRAAPLPTIASR
jgi:hypothetical protein